MLMKILNKLPDWLKVFIVFRMLDIDCIYRNIWLKYYLNILVKTRDYLKTLEILNSNSFCPYQLELQFIYEVRENYKEYVIC